MDSLMFFFLVNLEYFSTLKYYTVFVCRENYVK